MQKQVCKSVSCRFCWDWTNVYVIWGSGLNLDVLWNCKVFVPLTTVTIGISKRKPNPFRIWLSAARWLCRVSTGGSMIQNRHSQRNCDQKDRFDETQHWWINWWSNPPTPSGCFFASCFFPMPNGHPKTSGSPEKKNANCFNDCLVKMEEPIFSANFAGW